MSKDLQAQMDQLCERIISLKEVPALQSVADLLKDGADPREIMNCFSRSLMEIGRMYQSGRYYMTGLVLAGEIMRQALVVLMPHLARAQESKKNGLIIIGTIEGDIHDLGKNLAGYFLEAGGFEVVDLGVDVSPRIFLREILQREPDAVGVSLLLTTCIEPLQRLVNLLKDAYHERPAPPLFVGCGFLSRSLDEDGFVKIDEKERQRLGVDYVVADAYDTLKLCQQLTAPKNQPSEGLKWPQP